MGGGGGGGVHRSEGGEVFAARGGRSREREGKVDADRAEEVRSV